MKVLVLGVLVGLLVLFPLGVYLYVRLGFLSLATTARPLPLEEFLAKTALHASIGSAADCKNPLAPTEEDLLAGAKEYRDYCAVCHGLPGQPKTPFGAGMFPPAPQLLEGPSMVTDDLDGATFWKISNGIRLSGMPRFDTMPESARWQLTMLLKNADKLPLPAQAILRQPLAMPRLLLHEVGIAVPLLSGWLIETIGAGNTREAPTSFGLVFDLQLHGTSYETSGRSARAPAVPGVYDSPSRPGRCARDHPPRRCRRRAQLENRPELHVPATRGTPASRRPGKGEVVRGADLRRHVARRHALPATGPAGRPPVARHRREEGAGESRQKYRRTAARDRGGASQAPVRIPEAPGLAA